MLELRAATDLLSRSGSRTDHAALAALYEGFTEGRDLPDLVAAREGLACRGTGTAPRP